MNQHRRLQRRVLLATLIVAALVVIIGVPLMVLEDERYQLAQELDLVPGKDAVRLTGEDDGALLIVMPLAIDDPTMTADWAFRAQFIAWPNEDGNELEHLETHQRVQVPLSSIDFTSNNDEGTLLLMRGPLASSGEEAAFTIEPTTMKVTQLPSADFVPDVAGDWETPSWQKTTRLCERVSVERRFVGCFTRAAGASYLAGDWQLDLQIFANYKIVHPLYRGQGFVPWMGFAEADSVVYLQNELGIVRIEVPEGALDDAPHGTPYAPLRATPAD